MGILSRDGDDSADREQADGRGLRLDLEVRYCEHCRAELPPWRQVCPRDGGRALLAADLPSREDGLLGRLAQAEEGEGRP